MRDITQNMSAAHQSVILHYLHDGFWENKKTVQILQQVLQFLLISSVELSFQPGWKLKKCALIHTPELKTRDPCKVYTAVTTARHNEDYYYDDDEDGSTG
jgi:hypothetical protein